MHDLLVGYLLNALEDHEHLEVERLLKDDEIRQQFDTLQLGLAPLEADQNNVDVPARLAIRTCERIRIRFRSTP